MGPLKKLHVVGAGNIRTVFHRMLISSYSEEDFTKADLILFTGGSDVNPALYGEEANSYTSGINYSRDLEEKRIFNIAKSLNIPMIGICRGAQLGAVLSGHKLIQHVNNHLGGHVVYLNPNVGKYESIHLPGNHHQMALFNPKIPNYEVIGYAQDKFGANKHFSNMFLGENDEPILMSGVVEPEIFYIAENKFLGIQGHPEWKAVNFEVCDFFNELVNKYLL
jgi:gamma-glutamyl-gamma-aminobutyrate hydrolase PuuD